MARPPLRSVTDPGDDSPGLAGELVDERVAWPGTSLFPADKYAGFPPDREPESARVERFDNGEWCLCPLDFGPLEVTEDFLRDTWGPGKYRVTLWPDGKARRCAERTVKIVGGKRQRFPGDVYDASSAPGPGADPDERDDSPAGPPAPPVGAREYPPPPAPPRTQLPTRDERRDERRDAGGLVAAVVDLAPLAFRVMEHFEAAAAQRVTMEREFLMRLAERLESSARQQTEITVALLQSGQAGNAALTTASLGLAREIVSVNPTAALTRVAERAQTSRDDSRKAAVETFLKGAAWAVERAQGDGDDGPDDDEAADAIERLLGVPKKDVSEAGLDLVKSFSGWLRHKAHETPATSSSHVPPPPVPGVTAGPAASFSPLAPPPSPTDEGNE